MDLAVACVAKGNSKLSNAHKRGSRNRAVTPLLLRRAHASAEQHPAVSLMLPVRGPGPGVGCPDGRSVGAKVSHQFERVAVLEPIFVGHEIEGVELIAQQPA